MADHPDDRGGYDDEGSYSGSYSQGEEGSYNSGNEDQGSYHSGSGSRSQSDEGDRSYHDEQGGEEGSYDSRDRSHADEGDLSYNDDEGAEEGSYDSRDRSHTDEGDRSYHDDEEAEEGSYDSQDRSYTDEGDRSYHDDEGAEEGPDYEDDIDYRSGDDRSNSRSYYSDERSRDSRSYGEEGEDAGSYHSGSRSHGSQLYGDDGQSPREDDAGSYYSDDRSRSQSDRSRSHSQDGDEDPSRSVSHTDDKSPSHSLSQYDEERSRSGSYTNDSPSHSYSNEGDQSPSYDERYVNDENTRNRQSQKGGTAKSYGYNDDKGRSAGGKAVSDDASRRSGFSMNSSAPSFALESDSASQNSSRHREEASMFSKQPSQASSSAPSFFSAATATLPQERKLPYHENIQQNELFDSSASGAEDSFANDSGSQLDDSDARKSRSSHDAAAIELSPEIIRAGIQNVFESPNKIGGLYANRLDEDEYEDEDPIRLEDSGTMRTEESDINSQQRSLEAASQPVLLNEKLDEAGGSQGEDSGESDDDSFFQRSLISREPDMLPKITEHSVEQSDMDDSRSRNKFERRGSTGAKSAASFQSAGANSRAARSMASVASAVISVGSKSQGGSSQQAKKPTKRNSYSREQMKKLTDQQRGAGDGKLKAELEKSSRNSNEASKPNAESNGDKTKKKKKGPRKIHVKSESLLDLVANVNEVMMELEEKGKRSDWSETKEIEMDSTARRLLHGFEALVGILLQFSDELELMSTFARKRDETAIASLDSLLGFASMLDDVFVQIKPILQHGLAEEVDEELNEFLYGMNLTVDLLCELTHEVGEKQEWNHRANTAYATLLELLARDALEACCIFDDVDTPEYDPTETIEDAWAATGHEEEFKTLQVSNDLDVFRQICYDVLLSTDHWCPDVKTLVDICGIEDSMLEEKDETPIEEGDLFDPPEPALQALEKINGDPLPRTAIMSRILRRVLPSDAITDLLLLDKIWSMKASIRNSLGLPSSNLIAISSAPEVLNDPEALGVAGVGKSTLAAMVAHHPDVRRFFNDGIAWIHVGRKELTYARYVQCLREIVSQLKVQDGEEPLFPELLHVPGESRARRRRREEGFMLYIRDIMVEFLQFRNILIIVDDICFEPDLDWFDFDPAELLPDDAEEEHTCVILVTTRCRNLLPAADTVEVDLADEAEAVELLIKESGDLSNSLVAESSDTRSVVLECANHPLAVKSVGRWLNLKHATAGVVNSVEEIHADVVKSMEKILKRGNQEDTDMMYEILNMSLSPAINGEPTNIIKFCFAAFVRVFCDQKHVSDSAIADSTPVVPLFAAEKLFESLLDLEEETLLQEGSLFYAQKKEAAVLIPEALTALGVLKGIVTLVKPSEEGSQAREIEEKYLQVMHPIQEEYGEHLYQEDSSLADLTKDGERRWNRAFAQAYLSSSIDWDSETPDAGLDYGLEMMPSHMIRGGMLSEATSLLSNSSFIRGRLFALGRESGTRRHIKDCELLFDLLMEHRAAGRKKLDPKATIKQAYQVLGGLLPMDEDDYIAEEGSPEALEVARSHFEIGFSLAEKRCWEAAIAHWETSQELLVSALGMVEIVAAIQLNVGVVYAEMNEYEQALGSLKQCLRIRGAIHGEEHILYAQTIQKIGDIFLKMSDYHEAMESYNWALDVMHIEPSHHRIDIGDILENMGSIHYSKGEIEQALQCYQDALRSKQVDLGEDHPELSTAYQHIGNCLSDQGKTDEAIAHFEEAIRLKKMDPDGGGERDADVLTIEGVLLNLNGRPQEGLESYEKALQILVTKVPHKKEKVASLLHLIGCVYLMSGEQKKAMKLFEESLQARRKVLGFVHLDVASTLFNMAFLHQTRNRLDKALKCLEEALKIRQLRLPDSEKVAVTHEKIGTLARSIGKTKKAEIAFAEALRIRKLIHGDTHEAVATVLQELGDLMDDLGEYDEAMKYYVEALDIRQTRLGPDDLAVAETLYSMGFSLLNNGATDRALQCFEESLSIRQFQLGDDAKEVGDTLNMMGFLQAQGGELDEALSLLWDALRIRKLQEDHIKVSETLKNIGNVHREKQEFELAIECYEECLRIRRVERGDDHETVADALIAMGNVQSDLGNDDDAMHSYEDALRIRTMLYGEQDESVAAVLQYMGTLEFRAENLDRALQLLNEFIRIREEIGADSDGDYVNVLFMVGNIHKMRKNEEEAKRCWTEAYRVFQELGLAEENPQIAEVMNNLVKDSKALKEKPSPESFQDNDMRQKHSKGVFGRLSDKVKGSAKRRKDKGQQL